jgi:hypothetical protein
LSPLRDRPRRDQCGGQDFAVDKFTHLTYNVF